ncbi:MAG: GNAT family N-acetyltransferase [Gammaproteobacteria bacterium]
MKLTVAPLTQERWSDLESLFAGKGCSFARACWCMECRYDSTRPDLGKGEVRAAANRLALKALVDGGSVAGLIGYRGDTPVGWISLAPREEYGRLARSSAMKAVDDQRVWSVVCFVVPSAYRGQGVAQALLEAAVAYAKKRGARIVEGYPIDKPARSNDGFMWVGAKSMFDKAGFEEVARNTPQRPIMRRSTR